MAVKACNRKRYRGGKYCSGCSARVLQPHCAVLTDASLLIMANPLDAKYYVHDGVIILEWMIDKKKNKAVNHA